MYSAPYTVAVSNLDQAEHVVEAFVIDGAGTPVSGDAIYVLITYLGHSVGLTLTLAGVTGIIVSVGITVDSYIVYFERLKDEVRNGATVRSCVDRWRRRHN